eukprot:GHUV01035920.1.p1 GENE.GHUV01035920.1~~GHUV01035920.1.p1  ORF type:complete len:166 (+),score=35.05 GHUV01035920.1:268-765(+)
MPAEATAAAATTAAGSKDYKALGLRLHVNSPFISYVFIKHHVGHDSDSEVANALYVTGLPLGLDEVSLEGIFAVFGEVANVVVHPTKRSAALVYDDSSNVTKALSHAASGQIIECPLPLPEGPLGLKAWVAQHKARRPGNQQLQKQVQGCLGAADSWPCVQACAW